MNNRQLGQNSYQAGYPNTMGDPDQSLLDDVLRDQQMYQSRMRLYSQVANEQEGLECDLMRNMYEKNKYQINFGNKRELFDVNDAIFTLESPTKQVYPSDDKCVSCDKEVAKNKKLFWYVRFLLIFLVSFADTEPVKSAHTKNGLSRAPNTLSSR